ncbi:TPA: hypothetical protein DEP96_03355 [Candidatus Uhrbacteria bacterium]|nr:hypothetical protein [Candidatus Uhrbacteria bacterium]
MNFSIPKYLALDIDNTLIFGAEADVFYGRYKRALETAFAQEMKISIEQAQTCLNAYRTAYDGQGELAFETFGISQTCVYDAFCTVNPAGTLPMMKTTIATITRLLKYTKLIAITDGPVEQIDRIFTATGIRREWFTEIIGWERGKGKPKNGSSRIYADVIARYGIAPEEFMMVGDVYSIDVEPARQIGARSVHIGNSPESIADISLLSFT